MLPENHVIQDMIWVSRENIEACTNTRIDFGRKLKGFLVEGRLNDAGNLGRGPIARVVSFALEGLVDDELLSRLKDAYYSAG